MSSLELSGHTEMPHQVPHVTLHVNHAPGGQEAIQTYGERWHGSESISLSSKQPYHKIESN